MRTATLTTILTLLVACSPAVPATEAGADHQAFVTRYFDTFNRYDWTALSEMYAPTATFLDPSLGPVPVAQSREEFVRKYTELVATIRGLRDSVVAIHPSGPDRVIVEFVASGTTPDGAAFTLPIVTVFTLENGLITKDHTYYDQ